MVGKFLGLAIAYISCKYVLNRRDTAYGAKEYNMENTYAVSLLFRTYLQLIYAIARPRNLPTIVYIIRCQWLVNYSPYNCIDNEVT